MQRRKSFFTSTLLAVAIAGFASTLSGASQAACIGNCGTDTANGEVTNPPGFSSYDFVTTNGGPSGGGNLPSVFGSPGVNSTNGSTFTTGAFTTTPGELINFQFNYVTSDGAGFPDYAWAALMSTTGGSNYLIFSAETQPPPANTVPGATMPPLAPGASLVPPTSPIHSGSGSTGGPIWVELGGSSGTCFAAGCGLTGWVESLFNGEVADTYMLKFGVSNANDTIFDSGLAFAGIEVGGQPLLSVPEPASLILLSTGLLACLPGLRRRRRARTTSPRR
jgi:hypothetical protein